MTSLRIYIFTEITFKWFFSCMNPFMYYALVISRKCTITKFTFIWVSLSQLLLWTVNKLFIKNAFSHKLHLNVFSLYDFQSIYYLREMFFHKNYICMVFLQYVFLYGQSMYTFQEIFSQKIHLYDLSPEWHFSWIVSFLFSANAFHTIYIYMDFLQHDFFYGDSYCFCQQILFHTNYMSMFFSIMALFMNYQGAIYRKRLFTKITFILPFSRMQSFMGYQIWFFWKCFFTKITFISFFSTMNFFMLSQSVILNKGPLAKIIFECFLFHCELYYDGPMSLFVWVSFHLNYT